MNPRLFLEFAVSIGNSSAGAAANRRAISGAYFAAFNVVIEFLISQARLEPAKQDKHRAVKLSLIECKNADARQLGMKLDSLHTLRKIADYEMNNLDPEKEQFVKRACIISKDIINGLDGLDPADLANVIAGMQSWAANSQSGLRNL